MPNQLGTRRMVTVLLSFGLVGTQVNSKIIKRVPASGRQTMGNSLEADENTEKEGPSSGMGSIEVDSIGPVNSPGKVLDHLKKSVVRSETKGDPAKEDAQTQNGQGQEHSSLSMEFASKALGRAGGSAADKQSSALTSQDEAQWLQEVSNMQEQDAQSQQSLIKHGPPQGWAMYHEQQVEKRQQQATRDLIYRNPHEQVLPADAQMTGAVDNTRRHESELYYQGHTSNLLQSEFRPEPGESQDKNRVELSSNQAQGEMKIDIKKPIHDGEHLAFVQPIDYRFSPVTPEQKQWQQEHPNGPELGHIVHVHFRAKSDSDNKMTVQLMDSKPPYYQSGSERVDLSKDGQKDSDGFTTYDFYAIAPDTKGGTKLNLKFNLGREQKPGEIDIKDLNVQEVRSAPGINPAEVLKECRNNVSVKDENKRSSFMVCASGNIFTEKNVPIPEEVRKHEVEDIQKNHFDLSEKEQVDLLHKRMKEYQHKHALNETQKNDVLKSMHDMGINTITIPIYWSQIEKNKGQPDYAEVDHLIDLAHANGMKVKLHPIVWASCYPGWADESSEQRSSDTSQSTGKDSKQFDKGHTQSAIREHIDQVISHFGNKVDYMEVNEVNSTDVLQQPKTDKWGLPVRDKGQLQNEQTNNGLTDWVRKDGAAGVINQVDRWVRDDLMKYGSNAKLFSNDVILDQRTLSNDVQVSQDRYRPDAFGIQNHMFNGNSPVLAIDKEIHAYEQVGRPFYLSETTVQTSPVEKVDEACLSSEVREAIQQEKLYRAAHHLPQLSDADRHAQEVQAEALLMVYKRAISNKNVIGVAQWDFSDLNAWNNNTGGVLDSKLDPKISYFALQSFIKSHLSKQ